MYEILFNSHYKTLYRLIYNMICDKKYPDESFKC